MTKYPVLSNIIFTIKWVYASNQTAINDFIQSLVASNECVGIAQNDEAPFMEYTMHASDIPFAGCDITSKRYYMAVMSVIDLDEQKEVIE